MAKPVLDSENTENTKNTEEAENQNTSNKVIELSPNYST